MKKKRSCITKLFFVLGLFALVIAGSAYNEAIVFANPGDPQNDDNRHNTKVMTSYGRVMGFLDSNKTWGWKGIPFAKPPVGELRWKAPQDPDSWKGVKQTTEFSGVCPQYDDDLIVGDEDCLYLNVWRPRNREDDPLPVYFWIHGGGNSIGTASIDRYSGVNIASKSNMVVVSINYRLGPMGWFTHPALRNGDALDDSGNFGTLDIIKALEWVQDNIEAFGGDPDNVTIAGVSAGATDVFSMVISPLAAGIFHRGIAESGGTSTNSFTAGEARANEIIEQLLINDGTVTDPDPDNDPTLEELAATYRENMSDAQIKDYLTSKSAEEILGAYDPGIGGMISNPAIFRDGTVIHEGGFNVALALGDYNQVPMILGTNKEEHKLFIAGAYDTYTSDAAYQGFAEYITNVWWKPGGVDNPATALVAVEGQPDVYAYELLYGAYRYIYDPDVGDIVPDPDRYNAWLTDYYGTNFAVLFGASHGLEVSFFWGSHSFYDWGAFLYREDNRAGYEALTDAVMAYTAQFARTGNPGDAGGVEEWTPWSNVDGESKRILLDANATEAIIEMAIE